MADMAPSAGAALRAGAVPLPNDLRTGVCKEPWRQSSQPSLPARSPSEGDWRAGAPPLREAAAELVAKRLSTGRFQPPRPIACEAEQRDNNPGEESIFRYSFFQDGLKTADKLKQYIEKLAADLYNIKQTQDEEKKQLTALRDLIKSSLQLDQKEDSQSRQGGYSMHQLQGNKEYGSEKKGYLLKKSDGTHHGSNVVNLCRGN
uniref:Uncharacterized protein n=1 Tax=Sphaerodactylus townsendi TaxID=933632 RepID=A0ACB8FEA4_9SAUR